jgi:hypothetical protein
MKKTTRSYAIEGTPDGEIKISQPATGEGMVTITILHEQVSTMVALLQQAKDEILRGENVKNS